MVIIEHTDHIAQLGIFLAILAPIGGGPRGERGPGTQADPEAAAVAGMFPADEAHRPWCHPPSGDGPRCPRRVLLHKPSPQLFAADSIPCHEDFRSPLPDGDSYPDPADENVARPQPANAGLRVPRARGPGTSGQPALARPQFAHEPPRAGPRPGAVQAGGIRRRGDPHRVGPYRPHKSPGMAYVPQAGRGDLHSMRATFRKGGSFLAPRTRADR